MGLLVLAFDGDGESEGERQSLANSSNTSSAKASNRSTVACQAIKRKLTLRGEESMFNSTICRSFLHYRGRCYLGDLSLPSYVFMRVRTEWQTDWELFSTHPQCRAASLAALQTNSALKMRKSARHGHISPLHASGIIFTFSLALIFS